MRILWLAVCVLVIAGPGRAAEWAETIDARRIEGTVVAVTDKTVTVAAGRKKQVLPRREIAEVVFAARTDLLGGRNRTVIVTAEGDRILASDLRLADGRLSFHNRALGSIQMEPTGGATVYLADRRLTVRQLRRRCRQCDPPGAAKDVLIVAGKAGTYVPLAGVLKTVTDKAVTFHWQGADRKVALAKVKALRLAPVGRRARARCGVLVATDGSVLGFASIALRDGALSIGRAGQKALVVRREDVAAVRFFCDRVVNLADLKPLSVKEHGFFDKSRPYRLNRSVGGGDLVLGGRKYSTGLGLHSFCQLTYKLEAAYSKFVAIVGIDDAVRPLGDAAVTFLADGKTLAGPIRLTGTQEPKTVRLDLTGRRRLIIRVDFGPDHLDVADHVDLARARLIKADR